MNFSPRMAVGSARWLLWRPICFLASLEKQEALTGIRTHKIEQAYKSHDMTWHDMTRHDKTWQDMTRHDKTWQDMTRHYTLLYTVASCRLFRLVSRRCRSRWSLRRQNSIPKNLHQALVPERQACHFWRLNSRFRAALGSPWAGTYRLTARERVAAKKVEKTCCTGPCSFLWCELLQVGIEHVTDLLVFAETFLSLAINL